MDLGIPPLKIESMLESSPDNSRFCLWTDRGRAPCATHAKDRSAPKPARRMTSDAQRWLCESVAGSPTCNPP